MRSSTASILTIGFIASFLAVSIAFFFANVCSSSNKWSPCDGVDLVIVGGDCNDTVSSEIERDSLIDNMKELRREILKIEKEKAELAKKYDNIKASCQVQFSKDEMNSRGKNDTNMDEYQLKVDFLPIQHDGSANHPQTSVCRNLPLALPSPETIWMENIGAIFRKSKHRRDPDWDFKEFTALLMNLITPSILKKSIKSHPSRNAIRQVLDIVQRRHDYFVKLRPHSHQAPSELVDMPPPLKILVMGGSVSLGVLCNKNPQEIKAGRFFRIPCAWPWRLNHLINDLLGFEAVHIENISQGGLNTKIGELILDFKLFPDAFLPDGPDVIINAFSSNDMHILTMNDASSMNLTLSDALFEMNQNFIRKALSIRPQNPPLLVYLDDYLGNEQDKIMELMSFHNVISELSSYYPMMFVSYADAVRHLVYGSVEETWFSSPWVGKEGWERQIHPGMGMHMSVPWVFAFNILDLIVSFCNEEAYGSCIGNLSSCYEIIPDISESEIPGGPKPMPSVILPALTGELQLEHISKLWRSDLKSSSFVTEKNPSKLSRVCHNAWIAGVNLLKEEELKQVMKKIENFNSGWDVVSDNNKLGFAPISGVGSKVIIDINNSDSGIREVNILAMKSYGHDWDQSTARFTIFTNDENLPIHKEEIFGFHQSETSVTYSYKFDLRESIKQENLKLAIELVGGTKFKITGMAFCS